MMDTNMKSLSQKGFSLLEVMVAIIIFAIGMLALASLQGSLTRSAADANLRTVAANIGERTIEDLRAFGRIDVDPDGLIPAYADIADLTAHTVTDGGISLIRAIEVTDYFYDLASDNFTTTAPVGIAVSDFKLVEVTMSWGAGTGDNAGFQLDETQTALTSADLGSGSITLSAIVSSISTQGSGRVSAQEDDNAFEAFINYTPGENPDIVSLTLGDSRFKESLTPEPEVIRADELVETTFDVITYSQAGLSSLFLRREEFVAVSCECTLKAAPGSADSAGRRPTIWAGDEYLEPEFIDKAYGVSANNTQSPYCDTCCQDHHDGGTGTYDPDNDAGAILYNPYRASTEYMTGTFAGDHKHYKKDNRGNLSLAESVDDTYVEACRLVRKDGFFRVAQDFSMEGLNVFPYDYLVSTAEVSAYSAWLTGEVSTFVESVVTNEYGSSADYDFIPPALGEPGRTAAVNGVADGIVADGDLTLAYTTLPTVLNANFQQLRSRGIYVDYMTKDLRLTISCLAGGGDADSCKYGDVILDKTGSENALEIIPFFEVQMTFLNTWAETPADTVVDTTNEPLETGNTHSRGEVSKVASGGSAFAEATGHTGVLGFTDTDPIDFLYDELSVTNDIEVILDNTGNPADPGVIVTGTITSGVNGVQARNVEIVASNATCTFVGVTFTCLVPPASSGASMKLSNYHKQNDNDIVACSYEPTMTTTNGSDTANRPFTNFDLDNALDSIVYQISIEAVACGGG